ncbi:MAG: hypothetical protein H6657_01630 [Ardenticatenaceae bacterium]|nr:hypothetical protein [Ardenticatenaceae bacterium]
MGDKVTKGRLGPLSAPLLFVLLSGEQALLTQFFKGAPVFTGEMIDQETLFNGEFAG